MATTTLGTTGIEVTPMGFGTWAWGDSLFWGYGKDYGETDLRQAFQAAIDCGITFLDTAEVYGLGKSEQLLGKFVKAIHFGRIEKSNPAVDRGLKSLSQVGFAIKIGRAHV